MGLRLASISFAAFALGSCSYSYDLLAVAIDGRLAFTVDPSSDHKPDCIRSIDVSVDKGGPIAQPSVGDDDRLVRNGGVYWWKSFEVTSCPNPFPIFYGQRLKGIPFTYGDGKPDSVEAKPLRIGVVYEVTASSSGSGYGGGWFRITKDGRVENLPDDPTPAVTNEQGYDVTDYANMASPPDQGVYLPVTS
jgi:hypothetical protein